MTPQLPPGASLLDFIREKQAQGRRVFTTSRSAIITHQRCPRRRFKAYHERGLGITKIKLQAPLATGGYTHNGLAALLKGSSPQEAAGLACAQYQEEVMKRGLDLEANEDQLMVAQEQMALTEAFVHLAARRILPQLLQEYEILDVEREEWFVLYEDQRMCLVLEARCDALLREKFAPPILSSVLNTDPVPPGDLYVLSWKTLASWDRRQRLEAKTDMQGLSEAYAVELRVGEPVLGAKMVHLIKGKRKEYPDDSGKYIQSSPFVHAWMNATGPTPEFAWTYNWSSPDDVNEWGRPVQHRLGKGWKHCFIPEVMPIAEWVQMLDEGYVQKDIGRDALEAQYISPMPEPRSPDQKQHWLRQIETQEMAICTYLEQVETAVEDAPDAPPVEELLDSFFPQFTHSCNYPTECSMWNLCHTSEEVANPESLYQIRQPHHPGETLLSSEDL
jgi:hypothetical protein